MSIKLTPQKLKEAVLEGEKQKIIKDKEAVLRKIEEEKEEKKRIAEQKKKDRELADKYISEIPKYISDAVSRGQKTVKMFWVEYPDILESGHFALVFKELKRLNLNPRIGTDSGEDWNSFDTGYPRYWSQSYIVFDVPTS